MAYPDFKAAGAEVLGISPDSPETLMRYEQKKQTPFTFVSDRLGTISTAFGMRGKRQPRVTYVIQRGGSIAGVSKHEFRIPKHISETLKLVRLLGKP